MRPLLEPITQQINYVDLPETWRVPEIERFSIEKTLYDYQVDSLRCAARALYLYFGKERNDYRPDEAQNAGKLRKQDFINQYGISQINDFTVKKYETEADRKNRKENPVFKILSEFMVPQGEVVPYSQLINRMCFWMATGSGKTLVMIKLVEYLYCLRERSEIPPYNILILAPSEHLIGQIQRTIEEFNQSGLSINFVHLREHGKMFQGRLGDSVTVYYHRSDNISDIQKDALTDYRTYENYGKWYILLDEAHKGGKEDSKRQAYYAVMSRQGFLFNFSATFTDPEDIVTTVKKYNLEDFINNGHGKNIYLNESEYEAFKKRNRDISHDERQRIVLKSLITLAYVSLWIKKVRVETRLKDLYHSPLMLTLVNSVNTDMQKEGNDLWTFFQTLREIATGEISETLFDTLKKDLAKEWKKGKLFFAQTDGGIIEEDDMASVENMKLTDLREMVFLSRRKSSLQLIHSKDNKELAFQMKNADAPFALIRIGDTSNWRKNILKGFEVTTTLQEKSFFNDLEKSSITILMGSRSFFESWDSNRPNVINFINIGGTDAKKFVVQSVGRGVRIETLPNLRRRYEFLPPDCAEKDVIKKYAKRTQPAETLFLFATNLNAVKSVLGGLHSEKSGVFENVEGFEVSAKPIINGQEMQLLVPEYKEETEGRTSQAKFAMSQGTLDRFISYLEKTSDSVLAVRDNLTSQEIVDLRAIVDQNNNKIRLNREKNYSSLAFLLSRITSHMTKTGKIPDGIRCLDENQDIVHFRKIRAQLSREDLQVLKEKLTDVSKGAVGEAEKITLATKFVKKEISEEEFDEAMSRKDMDNFKGLVIKHVSSHYYVPIVIGERETSDFIKHIIREESEVQFLDDLEKWLVNNEPEWDAWMFSKIDESIDRIHIPYYDVTTNEYSHFYPDFIFWMCKDDQYSIVFVDPKGTEHKSSYLKIDEYKNLFEVNESQRNFKHDNISVSVGLLMFSSDHHTVPEAYRRFWTNNPADIFSCGLYS